MRQQMLDDAEGRRILKKRPLINSRTVDIPGLGRLSKDTFGFHYFKFLEINGVSPDTRRRVHFIDDDELAYVMQRYREAHDLIHTLLGMKTNLLGEISVKWVEALQFGLPMCITAAIFGPIRLKPKHRSLYTTTYLPWAIDAGKQAGFLLNIAFEERWTQPIQQLRLEFRIPGPPAGPATNPFDVSLSSSVSLDSTG